MLRLVALAMTAACAHGRVEKPILVTPELLPNLRIEMPPGPEIQVDDQDCDEYDEARLRASFDELRTSLVAHGFQLFDPPLSNLRLSHTHHVTTCTYDRQIEGTSTIVLRDRNGRVVERVSLFPLWPDGLVAQLLESARLAAFAKAPPVEPVAPVAPVATSTAIDPPALDPQVEARLAEYFELRLQEQGPIEGVDHRVIRLGETCVVTASIGGKTATERVPCDPDRIADAIDRIVERLNSP
jgi:hypothetical protein